MSKKKNDYAVDSRDVKMHYLYNKVMRTPSLENSQALQEELNHRTKMDTLFEKLFPVHMEAIKNKTTPLPTDFDCYRNLVETFEAECEKLDDYSLKYAKAFVAECEGMKSFPAAREETVHRIQTTCAIEKTLA